MSSLTIAHFFVLFYFVPLKLKTMSNKTENTSEGETTPGNTSSNYGALNLGDLGDVPVKLFPEDKQEKIFDETDFTPKSGAKRIPIPENFDHKKGDYEHGGCY